MYIIYDISVYLCHRHREIHIFLVTIRSLLSWQFNLLLKNKTESKQKNHKSNQNTRVMIVVSQNTDRIWHYIYCSETVVNSSMPTLEIPELVAGIISGYWHFMYSPWAISACDQWAAPTLHPLPASCILTSNSLQHPVPRSVLISCLLHFMRVETQKIMTFQGALCLEIYWTFTFTFCLCSDQQPQRRHNADLKNTLQWMELGAGKWILDAVIITCLITW